MPESLLYHSLELFWYSICALSATAWVSERQDEIDLLAKTFNTMVDCIQSLISQMREITENIAHGLRSPITRMRGIAEMMLTSGN